MARTLAEAGAVLRHPEILELDREWREDLLLAHPLAELSFVSLEEAAASLELLESWRREYAEQGSQTKLASLRKLALKIKNETLLITTSKHVHSRRRQEAGEIVLWLTIWLQQPTIFNEWLTLRRRSPEFLQLLDKTKD
ncbi:MAG TPA: hypothetical protein VJ124_23380 [Pyrinomonadaceae bacterium]|nr:hypothetical protein [Pyrinomonadaceae bacterium]